MIRRIIYSNPPILVSLPFFIALPLIVFFFSSSSPFHISRVPSKRVTIFLFFFSLSFYTARRNIVSHHTLFTLSVLLLWKKNKDRRRFALGSNHFEEYSFLNFESDGIFPWENFHFHKKSLEVFSNILSLNPLYYNFYSRPLTLFTHP